VFDGAADAGRSAAVSTQSRFGGSQGLRTCGRVVERGHLAVRRQVSRCERPGRCEGQEAHRGIEGIYVRHYKFKSAGAWTQVDLEPIRAQLRGPEWSKIVGTTSSENGADTEVWLHLAGNKSIGVAILAAEPNSVTVVNIAGTIDLESLAKLGGHFGVPKVKPADKAHEEK